MINDRNERMKEKVSVRARNRWDFILARLAGADLAQAMAAADRPNSHVPCPRHRPTKDGFRLFKDWRTTGGGICGKCGTFTSGFSLLEWLYGWDFATAARYIEELLDGVDPGVSAVRTAPVRVETRDSSSAEEFARKRQKLTEVMAGSVDIMDRSAEPAWIYLVSRGISLAAVKRVKSLRFHPALKYWGQDENGNPELLGCFPAILGIVTNSTGGRVSIHRIYLDAAGSKLAVAQPKKLMSSPWPVSGCCIRLQHPFSHVPRVLHVCEGVETGLAIRSVVRAPVWSGVSSSIMKGLKPPSGVEEVWIWTDVDRPAPGEELGAGELAARQLKTQLWEEGLRTRIMRPTLPLGCRDKVDWNDVLLTMGPSGFPYVDGMRSLQSRVEAQLQTAGDGITSEGEC